MTPWVIIYPPGDLSAAKELLVISSVKSRFDRLSDLEQDCMQAAAKRAEPPSPI